MLTLVYKKRLKQCEDVEYSNSLAICAVAGNEK